MQLHFNPDFGFAIAQVGISATEWVFIKLSGTANDKPSLCPANTVNQETDMNKLSVSVMAIGLLLSASAMAQDKDNDTKTSTPTATTTQSAPSGKTGDTGRLQNDRSTTKTNAQVKGSADVKASDRDDRRVRSSSRTRTTVGISTRDREYRRHHRRGYREEIRFGHRHCRMITVRTRHHHRVVVRHIRRCFR